MTCEAQGGFEVEVFQGGVVEFQAENGQGLVGGRHFALVGLTVDRLLDDVGFDETLLTVLQVGDAPADGGGLLRRLLSQVIPDVQESGFDQADHAGGQLDAAQELGELLLKPLGPDLNLGSAGFDPATIVRVRPAHLAAAVRGGQGAAAGGATDEASEGELGVLLFARRLSRGHGTPFQIELDAGPGSRVDERLMLAFRLDAPGARLGHPLVERVPQELGELLEAERSALLGDQAQGGDAPQDLCRRVSGGDSFEGFLHQPRAEVIEDDDLPAVTAVVLVAQRCRPGPAPPGDRLFHAGGDLLGAELVVELVEDGEDAFDGSAGGGVVQGLRGGAEAGARFHQELLERGVDVDISRKAGGVVDHHVLDEPRARAEVGEHLPQDCPVGRPRALPLFAVDGFDLPAVAGAVIAAGLFLDI